MMQSLRGAVEQRCLLSGDSIVGRINLCEYVLSNLALSDQGRVIVDLTEIDADEMARCKEVAARVYDHAARIKGIERKRLQSQAAWNSVLRDGLKRHLDDFRAAEHSDFEHLYERISELERKLKGATSIKRQIVTTGLSTLSIAVLLGLAALVDNPLADYVARLVSG